MSTVVTSGSSAARTRRPAPGRVVGVASTLVLAALLAAFVLMRPGMLDGPVAWVIVAGKSMEPGMRAGDVAFVRRHSTYRIGDVVAYRVPRGEPGAGVIVIHRIVGGSAEKGFLMRGDNGTGRDPWQPKPDAVIGEEFMTIPRIGLLASFLRTPLGLALLAGFVASMIALGSEPSQPRRRRPWRRR